MPHCAFPRWIVGTKRTEEYRMKNCTITKFGIVPLYLIQISW